MRLGQLARKLSLRPSQIVEFLAQQNISIEESSNTRMEDSHVVLVVQKYAPESLVNIVAEVDEVEESHEGVSSENEVAFVEEVIAQPNVEKIEPVGEPEVIRVPKIELSGLKVLGKIELPEPKKKEVITDDQIAESVTTEEQSVRPALKHRNAKGKPSDQKRERPQQQLRKNPIELQREREAREAEKKKKIAIEREKEKRKKYYEEKVKAIAQPKRVKPQKELPEENKRAVNDAQPKTWIGKFLRWWIR